MCCDNCCDCDNCCNCDSLQEFLTNNNYDSMRLYEFLRFFKSYNDPTVHDSSWYTKERLMDLFESLNINL